MAKAVTFILSVFPGQGVTAEAADMRMMAYDMALEEVPTWAIEEAVRRWISGKCGERRFAPTPPELRCAADEVVTITRGKIASLRWLAKAEVAAPPTPEAIERAQKLASMIKARPLPDED